MSQKLTVKTALKATEALWSELAESGNNHKPKTRFINDCPCCQYVLEQTNQVPLCAEKGLCRSSKIFETHRALCPLRSLWPDGCLTAGSPYLKWVMAGRKKATRVLAKQIADAAKAELKKLAGSWRAAA
jgi:hypothetical protein